MGGKRKKKKKILHFFPSLLPLFFPSLLPLFSIPECTQEGQRKGTTSKREAFPTLVQPAACFPPSQFLPQNCGVTSRKIVEQSCPPCVAPCRRHESNSCLLFVRQSLSRPRIVPDLTRRDKLPARSQRRHVHIYIRERVHSWRFRSETPASFLLLSTALSNVADKAVLINGRVVVEETSR